MITVPAETEELAILHIRNELEGQVTDLEIEQITELCNLPSEGTQTVQQIQNNDFEVADNVIVFPGNNTRN